MTKKNSISKKSLVIGIIILFLGASIIPSLGGLSIRKQSLLENITPFKGFDSRGNILYVGGSGPGNYTKIQDAIDNASNGDTVYVYNGTYFEHIIVDRSIGLIGEDKETTTIHGNWNGDIVRIIAIWVNMSGFTVTKCGSDEGDSAIEIFNTHHCGIVGNNIVDNYMHGQMWAYGIYLNESHDIHIARNNITDNRWGFVIKNSDDNTILQNNIIQNQRDGMDIITSYGNNILNNNISFNGRHGMALESCDGGTIDNNIVGSNTYPGIVLSDTYNISISENEIFLNQQGILIEAAWLSTLAPRKVIHTYKTIQPILHSS